jgi:hypothetical protein
MAAKSRKGFTRYTPFGGWNTDGNGPSLGAVTGVGVLASRRALYVLASMFLVILTGSAARMIDANLHGTMNAAVKKSAHVVPLDASLDVEASASPDEAPAPALVAARVRHTYTRHALLMEPASRAPGTDALGLGSVERSHRWKVLGGHGRNGVG